MNLVWMRPAILMRIIVVFLSPSRHVAMYPSIRLLQIFSTSFMFQRSLKTQSIVVLQS
jgi:hypothetical protein